MNASKKHPAISALSLIFMLTLVFIGFIGGAVFEGRSALVKDKYPINSIVNQALVQQNQLFKALKEEASEAMILWDQKTIEESKATNDKAVIETLKFVYFRFNERELGKLNPVQTYTYYYYLTVTAMALSWGEKHYISKATGQKRSFVEESEAQLLNLLKFTENNRETLGELWLYENQIDYRNRYMELAIGCRASLISPDKYPEFPISKGELGFPEQYLALHGIDEGHPTIGPCIKV